MKEKRPSKVIEFGCMLPHRHNPLHEIGAHGAHLVEFTGGAETLVMEAVRYRDRCVTFELRRRTIITKGIREAAPDLADAQQVLQDLLQQKQECRDEMNSKRQKSRTREKYPELVAKLHELKPRITEAGKKVKELDQLYTALGKIPAIEKGLESPRGTEEKKEKDRKKLEKLYEIVENYTPQERTKAKQISQLYAVTGNRVSALYRRLYNRSPLHWGTKNLIAESIRSTRGGDPPKRRGLDGKVTFEVQLQAVKKRFAELYDLEQGTSWAAQCSIEKVPRHEAEGRTRSGRPCNHGKRADNCYRLRIRIGRDEDGFVEVPFILRPERMPQDAQIKHVRLRRRDIHGKFRWYVQFVVASNEFGHELGDGEVGVDLGWRMRKHGIRVAYYDGSDAWHNELVLPHKHFLKRWDKVNSLWSIIKRNFNRHRDILKEWLNGRPDGEVPQWLLGATDTLSNWKSPRRLARLVYQWRDNRFDGDEEIYQKLHEWRLWNVKKVQWAKAQQNRTDRRRDDAYRKFAAELREKYHTVYIEDLDVKELRARAVPEESATADEVKYINTRAAVGKLKEALLKCGMKVVKRPAEWTTQLCSDCGELMMVDASRRIKVTCPHCGSEHDQDHNAAINLRLGNKPKPQSGSRDVA